MEREVGGGIGMGNTCKPMAVSFQCMTKSTTNKKKKQNRISLPAREVGELNSLVFFFFFLMKPVKEGMDFFPLVGTLISHNRG